MGKRPSEDVLADRLKTVGNIRHEEVMVGQPPPRIFQAGFGKEICCDGGHRLGGIDEPDLGSRHFLEERLNSYATAAIVLQAMMRSLTFRRRRNSVICLA